MTEAIATPIARDHAECELIRIVGGRLREARNLCNVSQLAASKQLGLCNSGALAKIENTTDNRNIKLRLIRDAARLYEVSIDFLFGLADDWETSARMTHERQTSAWLFAAWEKFRKRDIATLRALHDRVDALEGYAAQMLDAAIETQAALDRFVEIHPEFYEMRGSRLVGSIERAAAAARTAKARMMRFRREQQEKMA